MLQIKCLNALGPAHTPENNPPWAVYYPTYYACSFLLALSLCKYGTTCLHLMYKICMTFYLTLETSRIRCRECRKCKGTQASSYAKEPGLLFYQQRVQTDGQRRHQHCAPRRKTKIPPEATGSTALPNGPQSKFLEEVFQCCSDFLR